MEYTTLKVLEIDVTDDLMAEAENTSFRTVINIIMYISRDYFTK